MTCAALAAPMPGTRVSRRPRARQAVTPPTRVEHRVRQLERARRATARGRARSRPARCRRARRRRAAAASRAADRAAQALHRVHRDSPADAYAAACRIAALQALQSRLHIVPARSRPIAAHAVVVAGVTRRRARRSSRRKMNQAQGAIDARAPPAPNGRAGCAPGRVDALERRRSGEQRDYRQALDRWHATTLRRARAPPRRRKARARSDMAPSTAEIALESPESSRHCTAARSPRSGSTRASCHGERGPRGRYAATVPPWRPAERPTQIASESNAARQPQRPANAAHDGQDAKPNPACWRAVRLTRQTSQRPSTTSTMAMKPAMSSAMP